MFITENNLIPVAKEYDTVVCGGGIAGIAAALAASRNGAKTLLIENSFILGGLATAGLIAIYLPICDGKGKQVSFGIAEELLKLTVKHGTEYPENAESWINKESVKKGRYFTKYNPNVFSVLSESLLKDEKVDILFGTRVCAAKVEDNRITHIIIENKSGRSAISAKNFADCTGDADICALSGEETYIYPEGNILAGWYVRAKDGKNELCPLGACDSQRKNDELESVVKSKRISGLDADELSEFTLNSHKLTLEDFLKNGNVSDKNSLSTISSIPEMRMTRRLSGCYTQKYDENSKAFSDSVGLYADWESCARVYELPFSSLHGKKIKNLIAAGRCISSDDKLWNITRVIPVCAVSGEAAGTACALFADFNCADISKLQEVLKSNGTKIHLDEIY